MKTAEQLTRMMPTIREVESIVASFGYTKGTPEWSRMFNYWWTFYLKFVGVPK